MIAAVTVLETISAELAELERNGLLRSPATLEPTSEPCVYRLAGRSVIAFCSNDYLGLASAPRLRAAMTDAVEAYGAGAGASRLISGTLPIHREAERTLAAMVGAPDALLFSSGYAANVGALPVLLGRGDLAFSDRAN